jgi:hypothetical protein
VTSFGCASDCGVVIDQNDQFNTTDYVRPGNASYELDKKGIECSSCQWFSVDRETSNAAFGASFLGLFMLATLIVALFVL